jgi:hypothetical protein
MMGRRRPSLPAALFVVLGASSGVSCSSEARINLLDPGKTSEADAGATPDAGAGTTTIDDLRRNACARFVTSGDREQALLMLVIDVSNSMSTPYTADRTRWDIERDSLVDAVQSLPGSVGLGTLFFPNMATPPGQQPRPSSACVNTQSMIPVGLLGEQDSRQRSRVLHSLTSTQPNPQAGTPTLDAYLVGLQALGDTTLAGSRQMLLLTDGQPTFSENCVGTGEVDDPVDYHPIVDAIADARRAGVRTFVIGSPGSDSTAPGGQDARPWLSLAAQAGGTALPDCSPTGPHYCHYDLASEPDAARGLQRAFSDIQESIVSCAFAFPQIPDSFDVSSSLSVVVTTEDGKASLLTNDPSQNCDEGWHYAEDPPRVVLCDRTCKLVRDQSASRVEFLFSCAAPPP